MNDVTFPELTESVKDESLKAWLTQVGKLPEDFTVCEFMLKMLEGCSMAAKKKNETLNAGEKVLAYPPAVNGPVEVSKNGLPFFRSTASVTSVVVVNFDAAQAPNG
jgi:hypothetical protein